MNRRAWTGYALAFATLVVGACHHEKKFDPLQDEDFGTGTDGGGASSGLFIDLDAACATSMSTADKLPADLVFMFDRSDSMNNPNKWPACVTGLKAFFADSANTGVSASIQFFCGSGSAMQCSQDITDWTTPAVPVSPLPDGTSFAQSIDTQTFCNGTPTGAALTAAHAYATQISQPGHKVAVVLVTDGLPTDCGTLAQVVATAQSNAAHTPTYVIGVGSAISNLDMIAAGGGTQKAILVPTNDPTQVATDFQNALNKIRETTASCTYNLPAPPNGMSIDINNVNVVMTTSNSQGAIGYDPDCGSPNAGWRYDDPSAPTQIQLCPAACDVVQSDHNAQINVLFGCTTVIL